MAFDNSIVDLIISKAEKYGVDPAVALATAYQESSLNPKAEGPETRHGKARGLFQFIPSTAKQRGMKNVTDPEENADHGVRYIRENMDKFGGNVVLALAAHNAGPGAVQKAGGVPNFPETKKYLARIDAMVPEFQKVVADRKATQPTTPEETEGPDMETVVSRAFKNLAHPKAMEVLEKAGERGHPAAMAWGAALRNPENPKARAAVSKIIQTYMVPGVEASEKEAEPEKKTGVVKDFFEVLNKTFLAPGRFLRGLAVGEAEQLGQLFSGETITPGGPLLMALESAKGGDRALGGKDIVKKVFGEQAAALDVKFADLLQHVMPQLRMLRPSEDTGVLGTVTDILSDPVTPLLVVGSKKPTVKPDEAGKTFSKLLQLLPGFSKDEARVLLTKGAKVREAAKNPEAVLEVAEKARGAVSSFMSKAGEEIGRARKSLKADPLIDTMPVVKAMARHLKHRGVTLQVSQAGEISLNVGLNSPLKNTSALKVLEEHLADLIKKPNQKWSDLVAKREAISSSLKFASDQVVKPISDKTTRVVGQLRQRISMAIKKDPKVPASVKKADAVFSAKMDLAGKMNKLLGMESATADKLMAAVGPNKAYNRALLQKFDDASGKHIIEDLLVVRTAASKKHILSMSGESSGSGSQFIRRGVAAGFGWKAYDAFTKGDILGAISNAAGLAMMSPAFAGELAIRYGKMSPKARRIMHGALQTRPAMALWLSNRDFAIKSIETAEEQAEARKKVQK